MGNLKNVPNIDFSVGITSGEEFPLEINPIIIEGNITIPPRTPRLPSLPYKELSNPVFNEIVTFPPITNYTIQDVLPIFPVIQETECFLQTTSGDDIIVHVMKNNVLSEAVLEIECYSYS